MLCSDVSENMSARSVVPFSLPNPMQGAAANAPQLPPKKTLQSLITLVKSANGFHVRQSESRVAEKANQEFHNSTQVCFNDELPSKKDSWIPLNTLLRSVEALRTAAPEKRIGYEILCHLFVLAMRALDCRADFHPEYSRKTFSCVPATEGDYDTLDQLLLHAISRSGKFDEDFSKSLPCLIPLDETRAFYLYARVASSGNVADFDGADKPCDGRSASGIPVVAQSEDLALRDTPPTHRGSKV